MSKLWCRWPLIHILPFCERFSFSSRQRDALSWAQWSMELWTGTRTLPWRKTKIWSTFQISLFECWGAVNPIFKVLRKVQKSIHLPLCNRIFVSNKTPPGTCSKNTAFVVFRLLHRCWLKTDLKTCPYGSSIATFTCGRSLLILQMVDGENGWTRFRFLHLQLLHVLRLYYCICSLLHKKLTSLW